jgi:hypothetical protein
MKIWPSYETHQLRLVSLTYELLVSSCRQQVVERNPIVERVAPSSVRCVCLVTVHHPWLQSVERPDILWKYRIFKKENEVLLKIVIEDLVVWCLLPAACGFLDCLEFGPRKWGCRLTFTGLLVVASQKIKLFMETAARTSNKRISTKIIYV